MRVILKVDADELLDEQVTEPKIWVQLKRVPALKNIHAMRRRFGNDSTNVLL
jgi:hypothetical protein